MQSIRIFHVKVDFHDQTGIVTTTAIATTYIVHLQLVQLLSDNNIKGYNVFSLGSGNSYSLGSGNSYSLGSGNSYSLGSGSSYSLGSGNSYSLVQETVTAWVQETVAVSLLRATLLEYHGAFPSAPKQSKQNISSIL